MRAPPALLVTLVAGCADPSLAVKIDVSDSVLAEHLHPTDGSAAPDVRVRLRVIDAAQATRPAWPRGLAPVDPGDISAPRHRLTGPATCAELELGRIPAEVIDTATLTRPSDGVTDLTGVPRLGAKLFVAEMFEDGHRVGLGCAGHGRRHVQFDGCQRGHAVSPGRRVEPREWRRRDAICEFG